MRLSTRRIKMKIDMSEVKRNQESLNASIKVLKGQLQSAQVKLSQVVNSNGALDGTVKTAIDAKIQNHQLPMLVNYGHALDIMSSDYAAFIGTFQSEVGETDGSAILNTDYLSELGAIFSGISEALSHIQRDTSSTYSSISDLISLTNPSTSDITTELTEGKQILTDTTNRMSSFNGLGTPGTFAGMMTQQSVELASLGAVQGPNYTSPHVMSVYHSTNFSSKVKDNSTKNSSQYKVQIQTELSKELINNYYSKFPPQTNLQPYKLDAKTQELIDKANQGDQKAVSELIKQYDYKKAMEHKSPYRSQTEIDRDNQLVWKRTEIAANNMAGEYLNIYDAQRLITGIDPVTGKEANRYEAGFWLLMNYFPYARLFGKTVKAVDTIGDVAKVVDKIDDVADATKTIDKTMDTAKAVDKVTDTAKVVDKADDIKDGTKALTSQEIADKFVSGMEDISGQSGTRNFKSYGGYNKAIEDFNSLHLENVKEINTSFGKGYVGTLDDGTKVVVRPGSTSELGATLEFQIKQGKGGVSYEIRYGD